MLNADKGREETGRAGIGVWGPRRESGGIFSSGCWLKSTSLVT